MRTSATPTIFPDADALAAVCRKHGVRHLALFGSTLKGTARPDSDVDLLIDVDEDRKFSLINLVGVAQKVEDRLGLPANIFMRRSLEPEFVASLRREQVRVY